MKKRFSLFHLFHKKRKHKAAKLLVGAALLCASAFLASCDWDSTLEVQAASGDLSRSEPLTKAEVIKLLDDSNPRTRWPSNPYEIQPSKDNPYNQGKLTDEAIDAVLDRLNALRKMAGIPPVTSDPDWNDWCQYGAVVAWKANSIHHGGYTEPSDNQDFLNKGNASTSLSNMVAGSNAAEKMDSFQDDYGNWRTNLGHRMLQFAPSLAAIGIGASPGAVIEYCFENYAGVGGKKDYKQKPFDWNFVSWPSPGPFPASFGALNRGTGFWHIQINTAKYSGLSKTDSELKVTFTRTYDKKTWVFDSTTSDDIYKIRGNNTLLFHHTDYAAGDIVQVKVQGLKDKDGYPAADIIFNVEFFNYSPRS